MLFEPTTHCALTVLYVETFIYRAFYPTPSRNFCFSDPCMRFKSVGYYSCRKVELRGSRLKKC